MVRLTGGRPTSSSVSTPAISIELPGRSRASCLQRVRVVRPSTIGSVLRGWRRASRISSPGWASTRATKKRRIGSSGDSNTTRLWRIAKPAEQDLPDRARDPRRRSAASSTSATSSSTRRPARSSATSCSGSSSSAWSGSSSTRRCAAGSPRSRSGRSSTSCASALGFGAGLGALVAVRDREPDDAARPRSAASRSCLQLLSGLPYRVLIVVGVVGARRRLWVLPFEWIERVFGYGGLACWSSWSRRSSSTRTGASVAHGFVPHGTPADNLRSTRTSSSACSAPR